MSIREIDPTDADAQRIDSVMVAWRRQAGTAFEEDLRRRLGGPSEPDPEPQLDPLAFPPRVIESIALDRPDPEPVRVDSLIVAEQQERSSMDPHDVEDVERSAASTTGDTLVEDVAQHAAPRAAPVRHATPRRRNTKQWKKRHKARRR